MYGIQRPAIGGFGLLEARSGGLLGLPHRAPHLPPADEKRTPDAQQRDACGAHGADPLQVHALDLAARPPWKDGQAADLADRIDRDAPGVREAAAEIKAWIARPQGWSCP
ncbi:hypothetical protein [Streptomyces sp. NPDC057694]|uniref:hypothetical protein n=1 Tax=Streptomyces sp. NPDC057694 TaxID=3346216 RepID=UPI00367D7797